MRSRGGAVGGVEREMEARKPCGRRLRSGLRDKAEKPKKRKKGKHERDRIEKIIKRAKKKIPSAFFSFVFPVVFLHTSCCFLCFLPVGFSVSDFFTCFFYPDFFFVFLSLFLFCLVFWSNFVPTRTVMPVVLFS